MSLKTNEIEGVASNQDRLITTKELAELLGVSPDTINKSRVYKTKQFPPFIKMGSSVRYKMSTVSEWIKQQSET